MSTWSELAGIDPDRVVVVWIGYADVGGDRLAAVERLVQADAAEIDDFGIVRIDVASG